MPRLRLIQLPVPPPAALADTGNVPLAAGALAVAAGVHGLDARGLQVEVVPPAVTDALGDAALLDHVARDAPEFVGLSLYLWNVERSLHLARGVRQRSPHTRILIGGPEVTAGPCFALQSGDFDVAVAGEAEDRFARVMEQLLAGRDPTGVDGVAVRQADGSLTPFGREPVPDFALDRYPSPYLTGALPIDPLRSTYVETVRGCASKCAYCFYPRSSSSLRTLAPAAVEALIRRLHDGGARDVVFLDPTFNHRTQFEEVLAALARANPDRRLGFFGEVRPEGLTLAHVRGLAAAGFTKVEIGLQSVNVETLRRVQRFGNPHKVVEAARMLRDEGIEPLVDLIIGLPGDTPADVARGVDFLVEHDLADYCQVFPLSVLPGTAMRAAATAYGLQFDPAPPYRIRRTAGFTEDALADALFDAEDALGRRLDETPRLHLVAAASGRGDVIECDLDRDAPAPTVAADRHSALWLRSADPFVRRDRLRAVVADRLARDPHCTLDVVLRASLPFPLDLLDDLRAQLAAAPPSYQSRVLAHRGEDLQRRIGLVLDAAADLPQDWIDAALDEVPVFRDQSARAAAAAAADLGDVVPGARILDDTVDDATWQSLAEHADPEAVTFASRELERRWQARRIGYGS